MRSILRSAIKKLISAIAYPFVLIAVVLIIWQIGAINAGSKFILPEPIDAFKATGVILTRPAFWTAFFGSLSRTIISYCVSLVLAIGLAVLAFRFKILQNFLSPCVSVVRALPTMAVVLLLIIWFGAKTTPVIISLLVIMPTLYATILSCLESVDKDLIETCNLYKVKTRDKILRLYIPSVIKSSAMPLSSALSLNLKLMVAGEVLAMTARSIGAMMQLSSLYYATDELMALTLLTVITALLLEFVLYRVILVFTLRKKYMKRGERK